MNYDDYITYKGACEMIRIFDRICAYLKYKYGHEFTKEIDDLKILQANNLIKEIKRIGIIENIHDVEFKVFSQFGDDGIIQYLIENTDVSNNTFIEFGVENYIESNTRFLLQQNNWKGLVIDGTRSNINFIKKDDIYWMYDITAVECFVDAENINSIFIENGFSGEIGLLSIDIDGNDYWIWDSINSVNPVIVIVEYNSIFGPNHAITIPYDPVFSRAKAHYSNLYWGCSLKALCKLAEEKGYYLVGCNSNGNNAYFVRKDKIGCLHRLAVSEGYVESKFRESRDTNGELNFISGKDRIKVIQDMIVMDVEKNIEIKIKDILSYE